jgi:hypothetical protein
VLNRLVTVDEFKSYITINNFVEKHQNDFDVRSNGELIWESLFNDEISIRHNNIEKVYNIKRTYLYDIILDKMKFYIQYKFWNLLDDYEVDISKWSNEQIFFVPSLYIYLVVLKNGQMNILLTSLSEKKLKLIEVYQIGIIDIHLFRRRQMVLDKDIFYCI